MAKKQLVYNIALEEVMKLKLNSYHTIFLASMVARKVRHPEEKIPEIANKVNDMIPELYTKKKDFVRTTTNNEINRLEEELSNSDNVKEDWLQGWTVSCVVKKLAKIVFDETIKLEDN